jgi:hypothetical protein
VHAASFLRQHAQHHLSKRLIGVCRVGFLGVWYPLPRLALAAAEYALAWIDKTHGETCARPRTLLEDHGHGHGLRC